MREQRGRKATMMRRATRVLVVAAVVAGAAALLGANRASAAALGMVCTNGPSFTLGATVGTIETPDANSVFMWGYANDATGGNYQDPGPVLCVNQGDTVNITLNNHLSEPTSIVFPGQEGVQVSGGSPGQLTQEAAPGGSVHYTFTAGQPGTYLYESGTDPAKQVEMGLYGAIVVRPAGHANWAYNDSRTQFDPAREFLLVFHSIDPFLHQAVQNGGAYDWSAFHARYFTMTGRAFPDSIAANGVAWLPTQPYGSLVRVTDDSTLPALVRIVNASPLNHPFHPHGFHLRTIALDGRLLSSSTGQDASVEHFGDVVPAGGTQDNLFRFVERDRFCVGSACTAAGYTAEKPIPVTLPNYTDLTFKDNQTWYSGNPYLGVKGTLPTVVKSYNVCGEFYFPWHSHALNEFVNYDVGFGGLATLLRVDPAPGCTAFASSTKVLATLPNTTVSGSLVSGSFSDLSEFGDTSYYVLGSTTTATPTTAAGPVPAGNSFKVDWYGGQSGVATGGTNLNVTYKGYCSSTTSTAAVSCQQIVFIWNWRTNAWVPLVGPVAITAEGTTSVAVPPSPSAGKWSDYIGSGSNAGLARVRVFDYRPQTGGAAFRTRANFMKVVYDAP
jgi:hypothetical protein